MLLGVDMDSSFKDLTIVDIISEHHTYLRRLTEERWKDISDIEFSHTEWFLLSKLHQDSLSISKAASIINISRQAMQKCAKKLEDRGYIKFTQSEGNKRDKFMILTKEGLECSVKNSKLKEEIELEISKKIGNDTLKYLKETLQKYLI